MEYRIVNKQELAALAVFCYGALCSKTFDRVGLEYLHSVAKPDGYYNPIHNEFYVVCMVEHWLVGFAKVANYTKKINNTPVVVPFVTVISVHKDCRNMGISREICIIAANYSREINNTNWFGFSSFSSMGAKYVLPTARLLRDKLNFNIKLSDYDASSYKEF